MSEALEQLIRLRSEFGMVEASFVGMTVAGRKWS